MELPNILEKLTHNEKKQKEYFWALEIWDEWIKTAIWMVESGRSRVISLGSKEDWEEGNLDSLVSGVDKSLTVATEKLVDFEEEPSKVVFGLSEDWTRDNKIVDDHLQTLQKLCQKLELKAVGFVSTFDAVIRYLREMEGTPLSSILINPTNKYIYLAVVEVGQLKGVEKIIQSDNFAEDVLEGLLRFPNLEILPSRMMIFSGDENSASQNEEIKQDLIAYPWLDKKENPKTLPFLHFPKIELLPDDIDITSIVVAGGAEVAKSLGIKMEETEIEIQPQENNEPETIKEEIKKEEINNEKLEDAYLGFIKEEDVSEEIAPNIIPDNFEPVEQEQELIPVEKSNFDVLSYNHKEEVFKKKEKPNFLLKRPNFSFPRLKPLIFIGMLLIFLFAISVGGFLYIPKIKVTIVVAPKMLEKEMEIIVDPNQESVDMVSSIIPAQVVNSEESGEKSIVATGEKTVGERAKGELNIYNRTDGKKIFSSGTVIVGPGGLKFTLDEEVTVASKTPDLISGVDKWGESKTNATAENIGSAYNLASGSQFSFKDFSSASFLAKNSLAFAGGTSRQITAIAQKDQDILLKNLLDELSKKAIGGLTGKISTDTISIDGSFTAKETSRAFDRKVGDEAQNLNLKLTVKATGLVINKGDLLIYLEKSLSGSTPAGYELKKQDLKPTFEIIKKNMDGSYSLKIKINAIFFPTTNMAGITNFIKGKSENAIVDYFRSNIPGYQSFTATYDPSFVKKFQRIPYRVENIKIETRSN